MKRKIQMAFNGDIGECPKCGRDLQGEPIPEALRPLYGEGSTHYSKLVGVEIRGGGYDGVSYYECPFCKTRWDRWTGVESKNGKVG